MVKYLVEIIVLGLAEEDRNYSNDKCGSFGLYMIIYCNLLFHYNKSFIRIHTKLYVFSQKSSVMS